MRRSKIWITLLLWLFIPATSAQNNVSLGTSARAEVDQTNVFVNELVRYTIVVQVPTTTAGLEQLTIQPPLFEGFGQVEQGETLITRNVTVANITYTVRSQDFAIFPLRAGIQQIGPATITIPDTALSDGFTLQTEPNTINVRPLPADAPPDFVNAVGQFDITIVTDQTSADVGQPINAVIRIEGSGNVSSITQPRLDLPPEITRLDRPSRIEQESGQFGAIEFPFQLRGTQPLTSRLGVQISYFDPQSETYVTRRAQPVTITYHGVEPSDTSTPVTILPSTNTPILSTEVVPASTNTPLSTAINPPTVPPPTVVPSDTPGPTPTPQPSPTQTPARVVTLIDQTTEYLLSSPTLPRVFWVLWLIPPLLALAIIGVRGKHPRSTTHREYPTKPQPQRAPLKGSTALRKAIDRLDRMEAETGRDWYQEIAETIIRYIQQRAERQMNTEEIFGLLSSRLPNAAARLVLECLEEAAAGQYAPVTIEDAHALDTRTRQGLIELDATW